MAAHAETLAPQPLISMNTCHLRFTVFSGFCLLRCNLLRTYDSPGCLLSMPGVGARFSRHQCTIQIALVNTGERRGVQSWAQGVMWFTAQSPHHPAFSFYMFCHLTLPNVTRGRLSVFNLRVSVILFLATHFSLSLLRNYILTKALKINFRLIE